MFVVNLNTPQRTMQRKALTIRIDKRTDRALIKKAKEGKRSKNAVVEMALERYLFDRGEQN